jgi:hypothetical protein
MLKMYQKGVEKVNKRAIVLFASVFLVIFLVVPSAVAAGSITLTPTNQVPGGFVTVTGTGFGASKNVMIALGREINVVAQPFTPVTSSGYRGYNWTNQPIKPGSMHIHVVTISGPAQGYEEDIDDDGTGNLIRTNDMVLWGILDYALGGFSRNSSNTPNEYVWTASYTKYEYNVTSYGSITTTALGTFSANFTVPTVTSGNYDITVIDSSGNLATTTYDIVPEVLTIGFVLLLSAFASIIGSWQIRKRPRQLR